MPSNSFVKSISEIVDSRLFMHAVSCGAQEILDLLPHEYVDPSRVHELTDTSPSKVR